MDYLEIEGGSPLCGEVRIPGIEKRGAADSLRSPGGSRRSRCSRTARTSRTWGPCWRSSKATAAGRAGRGAGWCWTRGSLHSGRAPEDYASVSCAPRLCCWGACWGKAGRGLPSLIRAAASSGRGPSIMHLQALRELGAELTGGAGRAAGGLRPPALARGSGCHFQAWGLRKMWFCLRCGQKGTRSFRMPRESPRSQSFAGF